METTRQQSTTAGQRLRKKLRRNISLGRITLLLILAVTLVNQLLLLLKVNYHFLFSSAIPYWLNWVARKLGGPAGVTPLKVIAVILSVLVYFIYVTCWIGSARRSNFLKTALTLYCIDTVALVIFAVALLNNPFSCLLEILVHFIAIGLLYNAYRSAQQLRQMSKRRITKAQAAERSDSMRNQREYYN